MAQSIRCHKRQPGVHRRVMEGVFFVVGAALVWSPCLAQEDERPVAEIELRMQTIDGERVFVARGFSEESLTALSEDDVNDALTVYTLVDGVPSQFALFGDVARAETTLVFEPRFALRPGMSYRVKTSPRLGSVSRDFSIPETPRTPSTQVLEVYPSQELLPENLLKFYVQFSAPMSRGMVYEKARILDENGDHVELAFLEIEQELWDATGTRVTLLFDPGRIKRELRPRQDIGTPLRADRRYVLEIDRTWTDEDGLELRSTFKKPFGVTAHDEVCPNPKEWQISTPSIHSRKPLRITFAEPLDRAMLEHAITPLSDSGERIEGSITIDEAERRWSFVPDDAWQVADVQLRILTALEDRAGNSIHKPFEIDLTQPFESKYPDEFHVISISLEPPAFQNETDQE